MQLFLCEDLTRREDAYALLAYAARRRWGLEQLPAIARSEGGKPYFPTHPGYHFNISHSGTYALCALDDAPVGVDMEVVRPHHPKLAQRICSEEELAWLENQPNRARALLALWTAKESRVKCTGTGLTVPLRSIAVPLPPANQLDGLHFFFAQREDWLLSACGHSTPNGVQTLTRKEIFGENLTPIGLNDNILFNEAL